MAWVKLDAQLRMNPDVGGLSPDAFVLYVNSAGYVSYWNLKDVSEGLCRMTLGRMSRKVIAELVDAGLWEPAGDRRYRVRGEGKHWKRCAPQGRPRRTISEDVRIHVYRRDGFRCVTCGREDMLSIDHIHPHSLGGSERPDNLQTLCRPCNSRKGARV